MLTLTNDDREHWQKLARYWKEHDPSRAALVEAYLGPKRQLSRLLTPIKAFIAFFSESGKDIEDNNSDICWSWTVYTAFIRNQNGVLVETANPKTFRPEPMKAGIGTIVNYQLDVSPLAGLETGRDRKYQMPPRQILAAAVLGNWSLGRLLYEDWESGFEQSHLCGTADCYRPSHIRPELHIKNNTRKKCHEKCCRNMSEPSILAAELGCMHGKIGPFGDLEPCNIRARARAFNHVAFAKSFVPTLKARLKRVLAVAASSGTQTLLV